MKTFRVLLVSAVAFAAAVLLFGLLTLPPAHLALVNAAWRPTIRPIVVCGAYHVHTTRSDGTGTPDEVADAAARAGLQFVILTDHGNALRRADAPRYRSGVLVVDAVEISTHSGHYVALGLPAAPYPLGGEGRDVADDVTRLGGFGIVAHPESARGSLRWSDWTMPVAGIEWLNADSEWRSASVPRLAHETLEYLFRGPEAIAAVFERPASALARWDGLTRHGHVVGLAANDAHARFGVRREPEPSPGSAFKGLPSYEAIFRTFATRVDLEQPLSGTASTDAAMLVAALRAGHTYAAIDALAGPVSFEFRAQAGLAMAGEGDTLPAGSPLTLIARVSPAPGAEIALIRNGRVVAERAGERLAFDADGNPAVYRVEVRLTGRDVPWVVSNPIYVGGPLEPPVDRGADPAEGTGGRPIASHDPDGSAWHVEKDPSSRATVGAAQGAMSGALFEYTLGDGPRRAQYVAYGLPVKGLAGLDRLSFRASAARPMRVSIQLRKPDRGDGERWERSIYLDDTPRDITVALDQFRPVGPTGPLPSGAIDTILVVVDTTNALPGSSGTIRVGELKLEGKREPTS